MKLKGCSILVNYPDDEVEAAIRPDLTLDQLIELLRKLAETEPDMTSFVVTAAVDKT